MPPNLDNTLPNSPQWEAPNFSELLDAIPGIAYIVDDALCVQAVNHAWDDAAHLNDSNTISRENILGKPLLDAVSDEALRDFYQRIMRNILQGELSDFSQLLDIGQSAEGQKYYRLYICPLKDGGKNQALLLQVVDYTEEHHTKLELVERDRKLAQLQVSEDNRRREFVFFDRLRHMMDQTGNLTGTYQQVLADLIASLGVEYGAFYPFEDGKLQLEASCGFSEDLKAAIKELIDAKAFDFVEPVIHHFPSEGTSEQVARVLESQGVQVLAAIPTRYQGENRGLLLLASVNAERFGESDLGFLKFVGSVLIGVRAFQRIKDAYQIANSYQELFARDREQISTCCRDSDVLYNLVSERFAQAAKAMFATFNLVDKSKQMISISGHWNAPEIFKQSVGTEIGAMKIGESISGLSAVERRPIHFEDIAENEVYVPWNHLARDFGFNSIWAFPLMIGDDVLAIVNLYFPEAAHPLECELLRYIDALADYTALALQCEKFASTQKTEEKRTPTSALESLFSGNVSIQFHSPEGETCFECFLKSEEKTPRPSWTLAVREKDEIPCPQQAELNSEIAVLERMAKTFGNDFNNLLTGIMGHASLLAEELEQEHPSQADVESLIEAAQKASNLVQDILGFDRQHVSLTQQLDFSEITTALEKSQKAHLPEGIEFVCRSDVKDPGIIGDSAQILRILQHLVSNARHALPNGGRIDVSAERIHIDKPPTDAILTAVAGDYVRLRIQDNGIGISSEHSSHLFEPFFSAWTDKNQIGLGLASVMAITKCHNGWLQVQSQEGEGATFNIYLPCDVVQKEKCGV